MIDDDVLGRARHLARQQHKPFRYVINEALRKGLESFGFNNEKSSYTTEPHDMGLRRGYNLDNVQELLAQIEGEDSR